LPCILSGTNSYFFNFRLFFLFFEPSTGNFSDTVITKVVVNSQASEEDLHKYFKQSLRACFAGESFQNETEIVSKLYLNGNIIE